MRKGREARDEENQNKRNREGIKEDHQVRIASEARERREGGRRLVV